MSDKFAEQRFGSGTLDGKRRIFSGAIGDVHFVRDQIMIEMSQNFFLKAFVKIQVKRVHRAENPNVRYNFTLLAQKRRVLPAEWF